MMVKTGIGSIGGAIATLWFVLLIFEPVSGDLPLLRPNSIYGQREGIGWSPPIEDSMWRFLLYMVLWHVAFPLFSVASRGSHPQTRVARIRNLENASSLLLVLGLLFCLTGFLLNPIHLAGDWHPSLLSENSYANTPAGFAGSLIWTVGVLSSLSAMACEAAISICQPGPQPTPSKAQHQPSHQRIPATTGVRLAAFLLLICVPVLAVFLFVDVSEFFFGLVYFTPIQIEVLPSANGSSHFTFALWIPAIYLIGTSFDIVVARLSLKGMMGWALEQRST